MVGLLVPQHQIVRCVDDDLLQVDKGAQEPGGQGVGEGLWRRWPQTDCAHHRQACPRPPGTAFLWDSGQGGADGEEERPPPDAIVRHDRLLGGAGDGVVVLEEPQGAPSFRQKGEVGERVLASQSGAAGVSHSQAVQDLRAPARRERSASWPHGSQAGPGAANPERFFLPRLCLPCSPSLSRAF